LLGNKRFDFCYGGNRTDYCHDCGRRKIPKPEMLIEHRCGQTGRVSSCRSRVCFHLPQISAVRSVPDFIIGPTICSEPRDIVNQNGQKQAPSRKLAVGFEIKSKRVKLMDFNTWNPSQNNYDSSNDHYVSAMELRSICKRVVAHSDNLTHDFRSIH